MDRALVVVDDTELHRELLRDAGELAAGVGADLVVVSTMTEEEFNEDIEAIETIAEAETTGFGDRTVLEVAQQFAHEIAREELDGIDVDVEPVGKLVDEGEHATEIIEVAENNGCDHIFIPGRRRSPTGKALFGDTAQGVILNYPDAVTVVTG